MFCKLKPGVFVVVVSTEQTLRMLSPAKLSNSSEDAPGSGAPGYGRTWAHLIAFRSYGLKFFFRVTQLRTAESAKKHSSAPFSLASSTVRRSAVRCCAVSFPACGAVLRSAFSFVYTPDVNARKHTQLARASMYICPRAFYTAAGFIYFPYFYPLPVRTYTATNSTTAVVYMYNTGMVSYVYR